MRNQLSRTVQTVLCVVSVVSPDVMNLAASPPHSQPQPWQQHNKGQPGQILYSVIALLFNGCVWTHKASCVLWHLDCCQHWPEGTEAAAFLSSSCIVLILVPLMNTSPSQSNHSTPYIQTYRAKNKKSIEPRNKKTQKLPLQSASKQRVILQRKVVAGWWC